MEKSLGRSAKTEQNAFTRAPTPGLPPEAWERLAVIDVDTSIAPEGKTTQEVSNGKNRLLRMLKYLTGEVLLCDRVPNHLMHCREDSSA